MSHPPLWVMRRAPTVADPELFGGAACLVVFALNALLVLLELKLLFQQRDCVLDLVSLPLAKPLQPLWWIGHHIGPQKCVTKRRSTPRHCSRASALKSDNLVTTRERELLGVS